MGLYDDCGGAGDRSHHTGGCFSDMAVCGACADRPRTEDGIILYSGAVHFVYSDDILKEGKEAKVQLSKNRSGATINEPISVFMEPEAYVFGEDPGGVGEVLSESEFDDVFGGDLGDLGI